MENTAEGKEKKEHYIFGGTSTAAGIIFECEHQAAYARRLDDGQIKVLTGTKAEMMQEMKKVKESKYPDNDYPVYFALFFLALAIFYIVYTIRHHFTGWQIAGGIVFWLPGWWILTCLFTTITPVYKSNKDQLQFKRNHGAEHKVYNAYYQTNEVPDLSQAAKYSILCPSCGCAYYGVALFFMIVLGMMIAYLPQLGLLKFFLILLAEFIYILYALNGTHRHPFMLFEIPVTQQPRKEELEVSLAAFTTLYEIIVQKKEAAK